MITPCWRRGADDGAPLLANFTVVSQLITLVLILALGGNLRGEERQQSILPKDLKNGDFIEIIKVKGFSGQPIRGCYFLSPEAKSNDHLLFVGVPDEKPGFTLAVLPLRISNPPEKYDGSSDGVGRGIVVDDRYVIKRYNPSDEFRQKALQKISNLK